MDKCYNCGSYDCEQEGSREHLTIRCMRCGDVRFLESYRDEGQDKWRDERDRDDR
jgi:translation initiation factor 2 beta subunit (eIF-2beta)/eIF-5